VASAAQRYTGVSLVLPCVIYILRHFTNVNGSSLYDSSILWQTRMFVNNVRCGIRSSAWYSYRRTVTELSKVIIV